MIEVRDIKSPDIDQWHKLWHGYLDFYQETLLPEITQSLWDRLFDPNVPVIGHVAVHNDKIIGFSHSVIHPATWTNDPVCYLEDLYVDERARGKGAGQALIQNLLDMAKREKWNRVYWHTHHDNTRARALYDKFVSEGGFVRYAVYTDQA